MLSSWRGMIIDQITSRVLAHKLGRRHHCTDSESLQGLLTAFSTMSFHDLCSIPIELMPEGFQKAPVNNGFKIWDESHDNGYRRVKFTFHSPLRTDFEENNTASGEFYLIDEGKPTAVVLHGWLSPSLDYYKTMVMGALVERGINSLIFELPYHISRTPKGAISGELFVSGDMARTTSAIYQALVELKLIHKWLQECWGAQAGVYGISLGGLLGALAATLDEQLNFAVLVVPAVGPRETILQSILCKPVKRDLLESGFSKDDLATFCRLISPGETQPSIDKDRVLIVESVVDQIVFRASVERFYQQWGRPPIRRYQEGHISVLNRRDMLKDTAAFINECAIKPRE